MPLSRERARSSRGARLATPRSEPTSCSACAGPEQPARRCRSWRGTSRPRSVLMEGGTRSTGRESDAYSTAQALVALHDGGGVAIIDASYQRGIEFLLKTQAADGTLARRVASASTSAAQPAVLRRRVSARPRSVPVDAGRELGGHGAVVCARTGEAGRAAGVARDRAGERRALGRDDDLRHARRGAAAARRRSERRTRRRSPAARRR